MSTPRRASGGRRKVDELGRIVLPSALRKALDIGVGDELDIVAEGDAIVLRRVEERCVFCGTDRHLEAFRERFVCWSCSGALRALDRERAGEPPPSAV